MINKIKNICAHANTTVVLLSMAFVIGTSMGVGVYFFTASNEKASQFVLEEAELVFPYDMTHSTVIPIEESPGETQVSEQEFNMSEATLTMRPVSTPSAYILPSGTNDGIRLRTVVTR